MAKRKLILILIIVISLIGCSTLKKLDNSDEYKNAPSHDKAIVLPKNINVAAIENHYPVPKAENSSLAGASTLPPESSLVE